MFTSSRPDCDPMPPPSCPPPERAPLELVGPNRRKCHLLLGALIVTQLIASATSAASPYQTSIGGFNTHAANEVDSGAETVRQFGEAAAAPFPPSPPPQHSQESPNATSKADRQLGKCANGLQTFELLTGFIYKPSSSSEQLAMMPSTLQLTDCLEYCLHNSSCAAINFEMGLCVLLSTSAEQNAHNLYSSQFPVFTIYAEKRCLLSEQSAATLNKQRRRCQRAWTFERVAGFELRLKPRKRLTLANRELCMDACLLERDFECRSANWRRDSGECSLSDRDRHSLSQPEAGDQQLKSSLADFYGPAAATANSTRAAAASQRNQQGGLYLQNYYLPAAASALSGLLDRSRAAGGERPPPPLRRDLRQSSHYVDLPASAQVDYLENSCVYEPNKLCEFRKIQNRILKTVDSIYQDVNSLEECKQKCLGAPYRCFSFDYGDTAERVCRTSHLDQASLQAIKEPYLEVVGAITYELATCFNVTVQCKAREMVVSVSSSKAFRGKIYAKSRPSSCANDVREALQFELTMRYLDDACDVRRDDSSLARGSFSNDVVIQHHDRIVTTQDVGLSVYCQYDLANKSISTNSVDLAVERIPDGPFESKQQAAAASGALTVTSLATTVVRSPNVTMRITNMDGKPVSSATVGDRLALLFEIKEKTSPFGIFVREIVAMDGKQIVQQAANYSRTAAAAAAASKAGAADGQEYHLDESLIESAFASNNSIQFIDANGCPTDGQLMGPLVRMDPAGQRLLAPFDAFKFPTSDMVFFRAVVTSCVAECRPAECPAAAAQQQSDAPQEPSGARQSAPLDPPTTPLATGRSSATTARDEAELSSRAPTPPTTQLEFSRSTYSPPTTVVTTASFGAEDSPQEGSRASSPTLESGNGGSQSGAAQRLSTLAAAAAPDSDETGANDSLTTVAGFGGIGSGATGRSERTSSWQQQRATAAYEASSSATAAPASAASGQLPVEPSGANEVATNVTSNHFGAAGPLRPTTSATERPAAGQLQSLVGEFKKTFANSPDWLERFLVHLVNNVSDSTAPAAAAADQVTRLAAAGAESRLAPDERQAIGSFLERVSGKSFDEQLEQIFSSPSQISDRFLEFVAGDMIQRNRQIGTVAAKQEVAGDGKLAAVAAASGRKQTSAANVLETERRAAEEVALAAGARARRQQVAARKRDASLANLQTTADSYMGALHSYGKRRRRKRAAELPQNRVQFELAQSNSEPNELRRFTRAIVEMYHTERREPQQRRRLAPTRTRRDTQQAGVPQANELVVQSIKILDRLQFEDEAAPVAADRESLVRAARRESGGRSRFAAAEEEQPPSEPNLHRNVGQKLASSFSALGALLVAACFILVQVTMVAVYLIDSNRRRRQQLQAAAISATGRLLLDGSRVGVAAPGGRRPVERCTPAFPSGGRRVAR